MFEPFIQLVCGSITGTDSFASVMTHLQEALRSIASELSALPNEGENRVSLYGPLLGRSTMELTTTCLVGRIDPFRILMLREVQMRGTSGSQIDLGERTNIAIQWTGDVRPKDSVPTTIWEGDKPIHTITRALFASPYEEIYWKSAFTTVIDALTSHHQGPWFDELRLILSEQFVNRTKSECDQTYSTLSKGIHQEFVIPRTAFYNKVTVLGFLRDALRLSARVALVSNAIPTSQGRIAITDALNLFSTCQNLETAICPPPL